MSHRIYKQRLYGQFARVAQALASDRRLELIDLLAQAPRHVEALATETEMSVANVSQHLQVLRAANLVETERTGTRVTYRLAGDDVLSLWLGLRAVGTNRLPDIERIVQQFAVAGIEGTSISADELAIRLAEGAVTLIDVRPPLEYDSGHLPGAISVPPGEMQQRLKGLPRDRPIVAYCRGGYCLFADEAVALLRGEGVEAYRLDGGWPEWLVAGRAVARGVIGEPLRHF